MKISYLWLKEFIKTDLSIEKLAEYLTNLGLEVSNIESFSSVILKKNLNKVIIGEIIAKKKYCHISNLNLLYVKISNNQVVKIFSQAYNIKLNIKVAVAPIDTDFFLKNSVVNIFKSKIIEENIFGVLCSEFDLGIGRDPFKLIVFDKKLQIGTSVNDYNTSFDQDFILNIELTPNRSDAMSHFGVARELNIILSYNKAKKQFFNLHYKKKNFLKFNNSISFIINIENYSCCPRYSLLLLNNIKICSSPIWLKRRLESIGLQPQNNIVDVCHYIMYHLGQPLEVFDSIHIKNNIINIGFCDKNTEFISLDGITRILNGSELMIKDVNNIPLSIAGILGGEKFQITSRTNSIFLQSAYFDPVSIQKTRKMHSINSDASFRFERGIDPNLTIIALELAIELIYQTCQDSEIVFFIDKYPKPIINKKIFLRYSKINSLLGYIIDPKEIKKILILLNMNILFEDEHGLEVEVYPYRHDVTREIDLIEEILRIYGYNTIPISNKIKFSTNTFHVDQLYNIESKLANYLIFHGFYEVINNSFIPINNSILECIKLLNPLSKDLSMIRNKLTNNLLDNVLFNLNNQQESIKFFEFGNIHIKNNINFIEKSLLSLVLCGKSNLENWIINFREITFFELRGFVEQILSMLGINNYSESYFSNEIYEEGLQFLKDEVIIVELGILSKDLCISKNINKIVYSSDFYLDIIKTKLIQDKKIIQFSKFPISKRNLSFILNKNITYYQIKNIAFSVEKKLLKNIQLIDVYQGDSIPKESKSYTISFYIQDDNKNLTDKEINNCMQNICYKIIKVTKAILRDS